MFIPEAPIYFAVFLGILACLILGASLYLWKRTKEEREHEDRIPGSAKSKKVTQDKSSRMDKKKNVDKKEEEEAVEEEQPTSYLFDSDDLEIVPQAGRNITQSNAPYNFSKDDKDKHSPLPEETAPIQSFAQEPRRNTPGSLPDSLPDSLPATRSSRRENNIEWD